MNEWKLLDRVIAVHRPIVSLGVGITGAVLLSQALYWTPRTSDPNGWFFKSIKEWEEETGLTRAEQVTARKRLQAAKLMEEKLAGVPAKLFFRVDTEELSAQLRTLIGSMLDSSNQGCEAPASKDAGLELLKQAGNLQAKVKAKTTPQTTAKTTSSGEQPKRPKSGAARKIASGSGPIVLASPAGRQIELPGDLRYPRDESAKSFKTWSNYAYCMHKRYGVWPVFNARQAKLCTTIVDAVGGDVAPKLVAFYVGHSGDQFVISSCHSLTILSAQAEAWLLKAHSARAPQSDGDAKGAAHLAAVGDSVADAMAQRRGRSAI